MTDRIHHGPAWPLLEGFRAFRRGEELVAEACADWRQGWRLAALMAAERKRARIAREDLERRGLIGRNLDISQPRRRGRPRKPVPPRAEVAR